MLYFRESGRDEKDVFELFDSTDCKVTGTLVRFHDRWLYDTYALLTDEVVHLVAQFVGDRMRDNKTEFPDRNHVTFLRTPMEVLQKLSHELTRKAAEKEDGCFVSVGGLVTDIEELEAQREGLPVWLL